MVAHTGRIDVALAWERRRSNHRKATERSQWPLGTALLHNNHEAEGLSYPVCLMFANCCDRIVCMLTPKERTEYEQRASELARFLAGGSQDRKVLSDCFKKAWVMLFAEELLKASQYASTLLAGLSTDDFAAGGDKPARMRLYLAIQNAGEWGPYIIKASLEKVCAEDVRSAILNT